MNMKKLTKEQVLRRFREAHGWKYEYDFSTYKNTHKKMRMICPEHGEFWQSPEGHIKSESGCTFCGRILAGRNESKSFEEFVKRANKVFDNKYEYIKEDFVNFSTKTKIICPKHGIFYTRPAQHILGTGCNKCAQEIRARSKKLTKEKFIESANKVHFHKYNYDKVLYKNNKIKVEIVCPKHGSFFQTPHGHLSGKGCPMCKVWKRQEQIFNLLRETFPNETWIWEYRAKWLGIQSIDICNERIKLAIEYNGEQHYKPVKRFGGEISFLKNQERDKIKEEKIRNNGYKLYIVPYYDYDTDKIINDIKTFLNYENTEIQSGNF